MKSRHLELFTEISKACGVSGYTDEVAAIFMREANRLGLQCSRDALGSVSAIVPSKVVTNNTKHNVMITAHIDHVGYVVLKKDKKTNELRLAKVGLPCLEGDYYCISRTPNGDIDVVVTDEGEDEPYFARAVLEDECAIDKISIGDPIFYNNILESKPRGKFTGAFMDNKASIMAMIMAMEQVAKLRTNYHNLFFVLTSFEETGAYGAITATAKIKPAFAIVLDVFPVDSRSELSKGVIINKGPVYNPMLVDYIVKKATDNKISHEVLVPSPDGESDANYIIWQNGGTPVCEIGIPCINIHFPDEMVSKKSLLCTVKLLSAVCLGTREVTNLITGGSNGM